MALSHIHRTHRSGWLRAAVLGANDGVLSMSGLMVGVAAAQTQPHGVLVAGVAGLVAGMLSMAAGEYVSVSSQADIERADLAVEQQSLQNEFPQEQAELADIYVRRGLEPELAQRVAVQLMAFDALGAHARDDIGISDVTSARPMIAAMTSALSFASGGAVPLIAATLATRAALIPVVASVSLVLLALVGALAAQIGGARILPGTLRVLAWGALAMSVTGLAGRLF
ncbi:VIT1/CCC1 transporter family protein [Paraburkholderia phenazinium]|uniref:Predicted Fe2+/Mn2+ transporter, VIT1/CCC1 family n=1 Tax=Paraburkholderia phenazinium TaxID=60549 RepID=A0A1G8JRW9_9BURK|nr:VIT family protein [Paraburkholderia phenazinium]SDI33833.1 Predicted Fe2+/Mn2+ transporter, VIT1/CCC1 family [Paraburkholderia phenazinium]